MTAPTNARLAELADEATTCIMTCGLSSEEMVNYLKGFLRNVVDEVLTEKPQPKTRRPRAKARKHR